MSDEIERLAKLFDRLIEAYLWWRECGLLDGGEVDVEEVNIRLSEMVTVYEKQVQAVDEWVALMPDDLRQSAGLRLAELRERRFISTIETLEDWDVLDYLIAHLKSLKQLKANPDEHP